MTNSIFFELWNDIGNHYGYRQKDNVRICANYMEAAKAVPDRLASNVLSSVLKDCDRFPSLSKFSDICDMYAPKADGLKRVTNEKTCYYCSNSGLIPYNVWSEQNKYYAEILYICPKCDVGRASKRDCFTYFTERFSEEELEAVKEKNLAGRYGSVEEAQKAFYENIARMGAKNR